MDDWSLVNAPMGNSDEVRSYVPLGLCCIARNVGQDAESFDEKSRVVSPKGLCVQRASAESEGVVDV